MQREGLPPHLMNKPILFLKNNIISPTQSISQTRDKQN